MLAYVFWHWKADHVEGGRYEELLRDFHASLRATPSEGFTGSAAYALPEAPWTPQPGYEDWYFVSGFGALGPLNDAAVLPPHRDPHDAVARAVGGGTAGLYALRQGRAYAAAPAPSSTPLLAHWFSKPAGMRYAEVDALTAPFCREGASLWMRQMVLGPAPEFCLQSGRPWEAGSDLAARTLSLRAVWS